MGRFCPVRRCATVGLCLKPIRVALRCQRGYSRNDDFYLVSHEHAGTILRYTELITGPTSGDNFESCACICPHPVPEHGSAVTLSRKRGEGERESRTDCTTPIGVIPGFKARDPSIRGRGVRDVWMDCAITPFQMRGGMGPRDEPEDDICGSGWLCHHPPVSSSDLVRGPIDPQAWRP